MRKSRRNGSEIPRSIGENADAIRRLVAAVFQELGHLDMQSLAAWQSRCPYSGRLANRTHSSHDNGDGRGVFPAVLALCNALDLANVAVISQEGENALLELMNEGAKFRCSGVVTKHVIQELRRRSKRDSRKAIQAVHSTVRGDQGQK